MFAQRIPHKIVLLTTRFRYAGRHGLFKRARLFPDRIELMGLHFGARLEATLFLDEISRVEWRTGAPHGGNAIFHMQDGQTIALDLDQVDHWRAAFEGQVRWSPAASTALSRTRGLDLPMKDLVQYTSGMS